jgi:hypothetical protein
MKHRAEAGGRIARAMRRDLSVERIAPPTMTMRGVTRIGASKHNRVFGQRLDGVAP